MLDDELLRVVAAKDVSPSVLLKIKFLMVAWKVVFFCVWFLLVGNGGPTHRAFREVGRNAAGSITLVMPCRLHPRKDPPLVASLLSSLTF